MQVDVCALIFVTIFVVCVKSSNCDWNGYTRYCPYDCCGSSGYQYCCDNSPSTTPRTINYSSSTISFPIGIIDLVIIVVGSLAGLWILICIIRCCRRQCKGGTSGQVLHPHTNTAFDVTTAATPNNETQMPMTHLSPSYPTYPQMEDNATMNCPNDDKPSVKNTNGATLPSYNNVA